ncbi:MAG TPA: polysaccharide biosynthesis tyrosine autokinase [Actinomycetota bacterium]
MSRMFQEPPSVAPASGDGSLDLREFMGTVLRRKWLVLGVAIVVVALAAAYSYSRPKVFSSTASVVARPIRVQPTDEDPSDNLNMLTEAQMVRSTPVADIARTLIGRPQDLQDMLRRVTVTIPENTEILQISYTDSTPKRAQSGAQAFADGYLQFKGELARDGIDEDAARIQAEIDQLDLAMRQLEIDMQGMEEGSPELAAAESDRVSLEDTRLGLRNQLVTTIISSRDPGEVLIAAERPSSAISPKHQVDLALGVLLGIAAGMALASVRERMQDRIETPATLRNVLRAPTLGAIPDSQLLRGDLPRLVTIDERRSSPAEAYRALRANVLAAARDAKARTILVTSALEGEGKTTTAVNLAVALAQVGKSVVLISADLRFPRVHVLLGIGNEQGLGQVLQGSIELRDALVETPIQNLKVLPTGPVTADDEPVELLQSDRMVDVIRGCRQADVVIVDAPPIGPVADSLMLVDLLDAVIVVADAQEGTRARVAEARHQLAQVGGNILGGILNRIPESMTQPKYGSYNGRRTVNRYDDADRELAVLREEASRSSKTSSRA